MGVGSYAEVPIRKSKWIHIVGVADTSRTYFYKDGQYIRCDTYRGPAQGSCEIHYQAQPNQNLQLVIEPQPAERLYGLELRISAASFKEA